MVDYASEKLSLTVPLYLFFLHCSDAEVYLKNDIPGKPKIQQDILVKRGDGKCGSFCSCCNQLELHN